MYLLAQTAVSNYHDLLEAIFKESLKEKINWQLLPLGIEAPVDPIVYLAGKRPKGSRGSAAVDEFLRKLSDATSELETEGIDAARLMTIYDVSLNSIKKLEAADIVVGVQEDTSEGRLLVTRRMDPNKSHPYRQMDALRKLQEEGREMTTHQFQAVVWKTKLRDDPRYCWIEESTQTKKWSSEILTVMRSLSELDIEEAVQGYNQRLR